MRPVFDRLGWQAKPNEDPTNADVRRTAIERSRRWGDPGVVAEARRRFAAAVAGTSPLDMDTRGIVLPIVAAYADAGDVRSDPRDGKSEPRRGRGAHRLRRARRGARSEAAATGARHRRSRPRCRRRPRRSATVSCSAAAGRNPQLAWAFYQAHEQQLVGPVSEFSRALSMTNLPGDVLARRAARPARSVRARALAAERGPRTSPAGWSVRASRSRCRTACVQPPTPTSPAAHAPQPPPPTIDPAGRPSAGSGPPLSPGARRRVERSRSARTTSHGRRTYVRLSHARPTTRTLRLRRLADAPGRRPR